MINNINQSINQSKHIRIAPCREWIRDAYHICVISHRNWTLSYIANYFNITKF